MKIQYREWNLKPATMELVAQAESIIDEFAAQGYTLTLRQLYYQFVGRGLIENTERSYKNLGNVITKARYAGMVSWESIEDRGRQLNTFWYREDDQELIDVLSDNIRFDRWKGQENYIEVWVEKEALGNVIERACERFLVPHLSCKGFLSASEAWRAGMRLDAMLDEGKNCTIIHLGDHDPSGIDMTRDNQDRLDEFTHQRGIEVKRIALNMDQVEEYNPPPNPAKTTDSRYASYVVEHGSESWELDALRPNVIVDLITDAIESFIDMDEWEALDDQESEMKRDLDTLAAKWPEIKASFYE